MARMQTREDILRRKLALAAEQHDSDEEDKQEDKDKMPTTQVGHWIFGGGFPVLVWKRVDSVDCSS